MTEQTKRPGVHVSRLRSAEVIRNVWHLTPEGGTPVEALNDPDYWAHISRQLRPSDVVEVMPDDMSWRAEFLIGAIMGLKVYHARLSYQELKFTKPEGIVEYAIEWKGPHHKHAVVDKVSKASIKVGFETKDAATAWLQDYLKRAA